MPPSRPEASGRCAGTGNDDDDGLLSRASVAMNAYCQATGRNTWNCFFNGIGFITITISVYVSAQEEEADIKSSVFFRVNRCVYLNRHEFSSKIEMFRSKAHAF